MAQGRMIKRKITISKKFAALKTDKARLLWIYMLPFTDPNGRVKADAEDIRDEIIRKQRKGFSITKIEECLNDLHNVGLIIIYSVNGERYLEFTKFLDEQNIRLEREGKITIPPPDEGVIQDYSGSTPPLIEVNISKVNSIKDKYNDYVFLLKNEYSKLVEKFGEPNTKERIAALNDYIGSKGRKYRSHYHTILTWARKESKDADNNRISSGKPQRNEARRGSYAEQKSEYGQTVE